VARVVENEEIRCSARFAVAVAVAAYVVSVVIAVAQTAAAAELVAATLPLLLPVCLARKMGVTARCSIAEARNRVEGGLVLVFGWKALWHGDHSRVQQLALGDIRGIEGLSLTLSSVSEGYRNEVRETESRALRRVSCPWLELHLEVWVVDELGDHSFVVEKG